MSYDNQVLTSVIINEIRDFCKELTVSEKEQFLSEVEKLCKWERKIKNKDMRIDDFLDTINGGERLYICVPTEAESVASAYRLQWDASKRKYYIPGNTRVEDAVKIVRLVASRAALPEFIICVEFDELIYAGAEGLIGGERIYTEEK